MTFMRELRIAFACIAAVGCGEVASPNGTQALRSSHTDLAENRYEVGEFLTGEEVAHIFSLRNPFATTLRINDDDDVKPSCGCSDLIPANRVLQAYEQTSVRVVVRVPPKAGKFAHGGKIIWTSSDGQTLATSFILEGKAIQPVTAEPDVLYFTPEDIRGKARKDVFFKANVPVDWTTFSIRSSSLAFQYQDCRLCQNQLQCKVSCDLSKDIESFDGEIAVGVKLKGNPKAGDQDVVSGTVVIHSSQLIDLSIRPPIVTLIYSPDSRTRSAKILLRGQRVLEPAFSVESVSCPGYTVTWTLLRVGGSNSAILTMTFRTTCARTATAGDKATLRIKDSPPIVLSVIDVKPLVKPTLLEDLSGLPHL